MGVGEYISVSSQLDTEKADIEKEVEAHATASGRAHELEELAQIYVARGLDYQLARQVLSPSFRNNLDVYCHKLPSFPNMISLTVSCGKTL